MGSHTQLIFPKNLNAVREKAKSAISPIRPVDANSQADAHFLFTAQRTEAGDDLPPYYLVYFLLIELLGFRDLGRSEKIAWSVPIDLNGTAYLIEHRKFGVGVFAHDAKAEEKQAKQIVALIKKGVKVAEPFFEWLAEKAVSESKLNVRNNANWLFERYQYLRGLFDTASTEAEGRSLERVEVKHRAGTSIHFPGHRLSRNANWIALAVIDAFYCWTEHVFIHLAILEGEVTTGNEVSKLAGKEWQDKFKCALDIDDPDTKYHYDKLIIIKRQLRNFMAHGAFGKQGEAFDFHSGAGAVPVVLGHRQGRDHFSLSNELAFDDATAIATIEEFIAYLWSGPREPAKIYIQDSGLPLILSMASKGAYCEAMRSVDEMNDFVRHLGGQFDNAANMDW